MSLINYFTGSASAAQQGFKKQVFGGVIFTISVIITVMDRIAGIELDLFYIFLGAAGVCLFVYGMIRKKAST